MLVIRYRRVGKKNHAQFKIAVAEKSSSVKGKFVEILGSWDPHQKEAVLKEDRIKHWLKVGAQCSDSVYNLLISKGLIKGKKRKVNIKKKEETEKAEDQKIEDQKIEEPMNHPVQGKEKEEKEETKPADVAEEQKESPEKKSSK